MIQEKKRQLAEEKKPLPAVGDSENEGVFEDGPTQLTAEDYEKIGPLRTLALVK